MKDSYKKKDLVIANLRYYEEGKGVELGDLSTIILYNNKDIYYNVFDVTENYPVFKSSTKYGSYDSNGNQIGTKKEYVSGWLETGPCWIIEQPMFNEEEKEEEISIRELEDLILDNERYFKDRKKIAKKRLLKNPVRLFKILSNDTPHEEYMNKFFNDREKGKIMKK